MARRGSARDGGRPLRRRAAFRDPLPLVLVVCEGAVTEREYLHGFKAAHGITTVRIEVVTPGGDPLATVEEAARRSENARREAERGGDPNLAYDEVWCVFDVDQHARLAAARALAARHEINLAVSNPCFELWLLLHFAEHAAHTSAAQARRLLRKHLPQYDKHLTFEHVGDGYADAVRRADALDRHHAKLGQEGENPSTGVYRLTEGIRQFGKEARLS